MSDLPQLHDAPHWTARHGKPIIFVILTLVAVGVYLALDIPVAVFPETDFPAHRRRRRQRRLADRPDAGHRSRGPSKRPSIRCPGSTSLWSITSRGTAEIDLFFSWKVDMYRTLELVNAAMARVQSSLPSTAKITANRLTFAAFPIMGYSLTSDTIPQDKLWELATYELKPRLNRQAGVSTVVVQGGQVPEFQVQPDPAKLVQTGSHRAEHPRRDRPQQHDRLAGPDRDATISSFSAWSAARRARPEEIANIVVKTTPAGAPVRIGDVADGAALGDAGLHRGDRQHQARRAAQYLPPAGQQHGDRGQCGPRARSSASAASCPRASSCGPSTTSPRSSTTPSTACATPS